uniref:Uncharacterized protein n=1 Tax=Tanacetum cinerariifolium TaxID=118510 RepID=A0A6L2MG50_TANCI|nr:hypothetical protein [Tanacetum cinerariifolium]
MELVLEQTQQGSNYEVSVSTEGVKELKRKVKIKGEKKEALLILRQKPEHQSDTKVITIKMEILLEPTSNKILVDDEQFDMVNALHLFILRTVIKKRVEDVQLGVKSYQMKLNLTIPQTRCDGLKFKEPYTTVYKLRGVVYRNKSNQKILMWDDELHKFSDGMLKLVHENMDLMLHNFVLGYNSQGMPNRAWSGNDQKRTTVILKKIDKTLKERRIMRSLESFIGGRRIKTDYRLLVQTE